MRFKEIDELALFSVAVVLCLAGGVLFGFSWLWKTLIIVVSLIFFIVAMFKTYEVL